MDEKDPLREAMPVVVMSKGPEGGIFQDSCQDPVILLEAICRGGKAATQKINCSQQHTRGGAPYLGCEGGRCVTRWANSEALKEPSDSGEANEETTPSPALPSDKRTIAMRCADVDFGETLDRPAFSIGRGADGKVIKKRDRCFDDRVLIESSCEGHFIVERAFDCLDPSLADQHYSRCHLGACRN